LRTDRYTAFDMFIDELTIHAEAGNGGDGVVRWLRLRHMPKGGPAGGNGGNGGDVYVRAVRDMNILSKYTGTKLFRAGDGVPGGSRSRFGENGTDCIIDIPVGSKVTHMAEDRSFFLGTEGQREKILEGGKGGLGNEMFKSSINQTPQESTRGTEGQQSSIHIEVSLIADVGLIGLPNAGKSTLLNTFTNAQSAVGAYPFTTLEPHLGALYEFILADIPGLVSGASDGKGLGHKFLRHVGRTRMFLHCISLETCIDSTVDDVMRTYTTVRSELEKFNPEFIDREEWVVCTKTDLVTEEVAEAVQHALQPLKCPVFFISATENRGVKELRDALVQHLRGVARTVAEEKGT